jgi:putative phosphoribosyl transferase
MHSSRPVRIVSKSGENLQGELDVPDKAKALVLFAHGSGSSRLSPRNRWIAERLQSNHYATLLLDLLTESEEGSRQKVFDIELLASRLTEAALWVRTQGDISTLPVALFGASTGAGAALVAAADWPERFSAIVSRGGRPDLAGAHLSHVNQPTLLLVGGEDHEVIRLNRQALDKLTCEKQLVIVPGATHLFEEPGTLEIVAQKTVDWLDKQIPNQAFPFANRETAALLLARKLGKRDLRRPLVLAIPRGGVMTGSVIAEILSAPIDVVLTRKLKHPQQPELAIGAISEDGESFLNRLGEDILEINPEYLKNEKQSELKEIERRKKLIREFLPHESLDDRTVILVDDGIATGATVFASLKLLRKKKPYELIVATPVAPLDTIKKLKKVCDEVIVLETPSPFFAIGEFYEEFPQVEDEEMIEVLKTHNLVNQAS